MKKAFIILFCVFSFIGYGNESKDSLDIISSYNKYTKEDILQLRDQGEKENNAKLLGDVHWWLGQFHHYNDEGDGKQAAMDAYLKSIYYYDQNQDTVNSNKVRGYLADFYLDEGYYQDAIDLIQSLLEYFQAHRDIKNIAHCLSDLAGAYYEMGDFDEELKYLLLSNELALQTKDSFLLAINYTKIGRNYLEVGDYEKAINYSQLAVPLAIKKRVVIVSWAVHLEAVALKRRGRYREAIPILLEVLKEYYQGDLLARAKVMKDLSDCYEEIGAYQKALDYYKSGSEIVDSVKTIDKDIKLNEILIKYDKEKNENQILSLKHEQYLLGVNAKKQKIVIYLLIGGLILFTLMGLLGWRFYTTRTKQNRVIAKQEKEIQNQKLQALTREMQANAIKAIVKGQEEERQRIARELHDGLGGLLSALRLQLDSLKKQSEIKQKDYNKAIQLVETSVQEVRTIARQALPESLNQMGLISAIKDFLNHARTKEGPEIDFQYYGDIQLPKSTTLVVYRIVQELVNNVLKYARANELMVLLVQTKDSFTISIEDDGDGFNPEEISSGIGIKNLKHRTDFLKGELLINSTPGNGSSFIIIFPLQ